VVAARLSKANAEAASLQANADAKSDTQSVNQSSVRKPSVLTGQKGGRQQQQQAQQPQVASPPAQRSDSFVSKKLELPPQLNENGEEEEFYNCVLPDDVLVELLADRMQVRVCLDKPSGQNRRKSSL